MTPTGGGSETPSPRVQERSMSKDIEVKIGSTIYEKIQTSRMSERERQIALNAMRNADLFVDAIVWIVKKIERLGGRLFLKPGLKH
jgi:hypothetical protein